MGVQALKIGTAAAAALCLAALAWQAIQTLRYGRRKASSPPSGSAARGTLYAFSMGMMPWAKESAARHRLTWAAGVIYHGALCLAFLELGRHLRSPVPPPALAAPFRIVWVAGLLCGLGLFFKRLVTPELRSISCPDDYIANLLADGFLLLALLTSWRPGATPLFYLWVTILFLYIPLGKIRHCFFFFYTRLLLGAFFGRRGVLPHASQTGSES